MKIIETELTPELAAQLLAKAHPNQRRPARQTVEMYTRAIKEGRWRLVADAILVDSDGHMFNGGHRCAAVIAAHRSIPVMICWDADSTTFDVIDVGRRRSAYQFISETEAAARASAARVTLWYERRFDRPLQPRHIGFDLHEIMTEAENRSAAFDAMVPSARTTYEYTGLPLSVTLGAYAIAFDFGYQEEVEAFVRGIADPLGLEIGDPARLLSERFRRQVHRSRRRNLVDDWTILVRALNFHLEGRSAQHLQLSEYWPRVAELEADFNRRRNALSKARKGHEHAVVRDTRKSGAA